MEPRQYTARIDQDRVLVLRENVLVATGRWTGTRIEDLSGRLLPEPAPCARPDDGAPIDAEARRTADDQAGEARLAEEEAILAGLERKLAEEEEEALAAVSAGACNADGIDLTLIEWILRLTPRERFDVLESYTGIPYRQILDVLARHEVDVIVVGGVAAHFYGASYHTKDMDLVYSREPENIRRLLAALEDMDTIHRDFAGRRIRPKASFFPLPTAKLLLTKFGPLDLLGTLSLEEDDTGYDDLVGDATLVDLSGTPVRILSLARLIAVKERLKRPNDLLVLPILNAALERSKLR
jgi:nucleotide-binding universal stress UspA family protein